MEDKYAIASNKPSIITIYDQERRVRLEEPSLVAINKRNGCVLALGREAQTVIEQINSMRASPPLQNGSAADFHLASEDVIVGSPLKNGAIADYEWASKMFQYFIYTINGRSLFRRPRIAVCAPADMTRVEHKAFYKLIKSIGAKNVFIIERPFENSDIPNSYKIIIEINPETN